MTTKEMAALVMQEVRRWVAAQMTPLGERLKAVEEMDTGHILSLGELRRRLETVEGRPLPEKGKDADLSVVNQMVADRVAPIEKELAELRDLATGLPALIKGLHDESLALAAVPAPKDGKDADPAVIKAMVDEAVQAIPVPKDGDPGKDADPLEIVKAVLALIPKPQDGKDGIGTREELVAVARELISLELDAAVEKAVTFAVAQIPRLEWKGVWAEGEYTKGNNVTWAGSLWICVVEKTTAKPETNADWKLAVKRGRDGH
jgi:hypothetical protein